MLPVVIEELIRNTLNSNTHIERRQFYYSTLLNIKKAVDEAIKKYEIEKKFKGKK